MEARNQLLGMASQDKRLAKVRPNGMEDVPEYRVDVGWQKLAPLAFPLPRSTTPSSTPSVALT
jgi:HAE1 family hydrophobic/amphiphilic exporter-1